METTDFIVVLVTSPSEEEAERLASRLVEEKLAACINVMPTTSLFHWEDRLSRENERLLVIKTRNSLFGKLEKRIKELHSYEIPEIIALPVVAGSEEYLGWLAENVSEG
ncbi:MAG: hypothetical protein AMJ41_00285 [candidate division Zixibacteria bacterium DG_27]|nr:MAG: hypothetical protein AMJ41_00285 [candidate division Zixibacteria bacterium DG_27]